MNLRQILAAPNKNPSLGKNSEKSAGDDAFGVRQTYGGTITPLRISPSFAVRLPPKLEFRGSEAAGGAAWRSRTFAGAKGDNQGRHIRHASLVSKSP